MSKDYGETTCVCGRKFVIPYPSLQKPTAIAPSEHDLKAMCYALTQELIHHQNNTCPWVHNERAKAMYSAKPAPRKSIGRMI